MTHPVSVMALFCDDIRDERSGQASLVGIMLDNASVPPPPPGESEVGMIPRVGIYMRASFDVDAEINQIDFVLEMPSGETFNIGHVESATIEEAKATKNNGNPFATVISSVRMQPLVFKKLGRATVRCIIDGKVYVAGFLNLIHESS